ncbi:ribosomal protein S5 [Homalodisca vitripennis]|nr:ribosomal protein S5 [Homalodisca vitripennis]
MADGEDWGVDEPILTADTIPVAQDPELPEIKLFCRWNCDDMQVSDMCLQDVDLETRQSSGPSSSGERWSARNMTGNSLRW